MQEHRLEEGPFVGKVVVDEIARHARLSGELGERHAFEAPLPEGAGGDFENLLFSLGVSAAQDGFSHFLFPWRTIVHSPIV